MRSRGHVFGLIVSLSLHALLFAVWGGYEGPRVVFERGAAAVTLNIMPSVASRAAAPPKATDTPQPEAQTPQAEPEAVVEIEEAPEPETAVEPTPLPPVPEPPPESIQPPLEEPRPEPEPTPPAETQAQPQDVKEAPPQEPARQTSTDPEPSKTRTGQPAQDAEPGRAPSPPDAEATGDSEAQSVDSVDANADLREKGVDSPARAANLPRPTYPLYSRRRGEEGRAVLLVEVRPDGSVGKVEVVESSGHRRLDRAALRALQRATFIPAKQGGRPVAAWQRIAFVFRLQGSETP